MWPAERVRQPLAGGTVVRSARRPRRRLERSAAARGHLGEPPRHAARRRARRRWSGSASCRASRSPGYLRSVPRRAGRADRPVGAGRRRHLGAGEPSTIMSPPRRSARPARRRRGGAGLSPGCRSPARGPRRCASRSTGCPRTRSPGCSTRPCSGTGSGPNICSSAGRARRPANERARRAYETAARTAEAEAAAYRSGCACVFAAVVRGRAGRVAAGRGPAGVRSVDPAPEVRRAGPRRVPAAAARAGRDGPGGPERIPASCAKR